jgi:hypothetical protein
MKVSQLLESFSADDFKSIVTNKVNQFGLKLGHSIEEFQECDFWITDKQYYDVYALGISTEVGNLSISDLVDKDSPAFQKIQNKLAKKNAKAKWVKVGECANAIRDELAARGLKSIEVPHYYQDSHGEILTNSYMRGPDFDFVDWLTRLAKRGMEEVEDEFHFYFKHVQFDYDDVDSGRGYGPDD